MAVAMATDKRSRPSQRSLHPDESTDGAFFTKLSSGGLLRAFKRRHSSSTPTKIPGKTLRTSGGDRQTVSIELRQYDHSKGAFTYDSFQLGKGHRFCLMPLNNATWCDLCGDLIWGLLNNNCLRCNNCNYTCHHKCRQLVSLDCTNPLREMPAETSLISQLIEEQPSPSTTLSSLSNGSVVSCDTSSSGISTGSEFSESGLPTGITRDELKSKIEDFNRMSQGLQMVLHHDGETFRGFIRVHMELHRPINIITGERPTSIFDIMAGDTFEKRRTRDSFYIPKDTVKALHVTSDTTSEEVIEALLKKFKVSDNPRKFALYERYTDERHKIVIRRISTEEHPLWLCLQWGRANARSLVMQENETGEIAWEVFSIPELENFLRILSKEEADYEQQVRKRYDSYRNRLQGALSKVEPSLRGQDI